MHPCPHPLRLPATRTLAAPFVAPLAAFSALALGPLGVQAAPQFADQEVVCQLDASRQARRQASSLNRAQPVAQQMLVNGNLVWTAAGGLPTPVIKPGDLITLMGSGFGEGTDIDFSKIMIGNSRVLETDLVMYKQKLDIASSANYEIPTVRSQWPKDVQSWSDTRVEFRVPAHASKGPLRLQVQKRIGALASITQPGQPHLVIDPQRSRLELPPEPNCDVVSLLADDTRAIAPIQVSVQNPSFAQLAAKGQAIFWAYDYGLGVAHSFKGLNWDKIFGGKAIDPYTRKVVDPVESFGAIRAVRGQVPDVAIDPYSFNPYPQESPIPGFLLVEKQLTAGQTRGTGWVGYRYAESSHPLQGKGSWIGFNCASCHGAQISYQKGGSQITKVFPGPPNPRWTQRWTVLGDKSGDTTATFAYIEDNEPGPSWQPGTAKVDKTALLYLMPHGTTEATLTRKAGEGTQYDNDYIFAPIAIPNVTHHLPIRRSLSHTEAYVGFEGSYVHAQEPEGAFGAMDADSLKAFTAYMSTLDQDDDDLRNVGLYRWLKSSGRLSQAGSSTLAEGAFVQNGWQRYPGVAAAVARGKASFDQTCAACHSDKLGAHTNEKMLPLREVGRFFAFSDFQYKQQSIRATFLRNLYWVSNRGLLTDAHVRNLDELVHPDRCTEGSALYNRYYTLHAPARPAPGTPDAPLVAPDLNRKGDVFRVFKAKPRNVFDTTAPARNRFIERHKYFVTVPWDTQHYYWDYQKMRREFGPEIGAPGPIGLPAAPHPWCARSAAEVPDLVQYLLTL